MAKRTYCSRPPEAKHPRVARIWDWAERRFGPLQTVTYHRRSTRGGLQHEYEFRFADGTMVTKAAGEIP